MKMAFYELHGRLNNGGLVRIPDGNGYYTVYWPEGFELRLRARTDAVESYVRRGETVNLVYPLEVLEAKLEAVRGIEDKAYRDILYIGKADGKNGLRQRITQFVAYGYKEGNNHRGGRALWQIVNNKSLLLDYVICEDAEAKERELLVDYEQKCHTLPFANWQL